MTEATIFDSSAFSENMSSESIADINEPTAIEQILAHRMRKDFLLQELNCNAFDPLFYNVDRKKFFDSGGPGDFDILIYKDSNPEQITIVEVKKIKIIAVDGKLDKINNLGKLKELYNQAHDRLQLGFHKVYMALLLQADLQSRQTPNSLRRDIANNTSDQIQISLEKLQDMREEIGMLFLKYYQPTAKHHSERSNFCVYNGKNAKPQKQATTITEAARRFLATGSASFS